MATPLHNHSYYSAYDGLSKPIEIATRVADLGYSACACTDHDVVAGHPEFHAVLKDKGIKPILGIETYQSPITRFENAKALRDKETGWRLDNFHLILFAMNEEGLRNLYRMNSEAHGTGFYYNARVDWELLRKYNQGIIATSACGLGILQQALQGNPYAGNPETVLQQYLSIFGDRFYLELSTYPAEWQLKLNVDTLALSNLYSVPLVYGNDAHYAFPGQYELHEIIMAMQVQKKLKDITEPAFEQALYIMSEDEVRDHLYYLPVSKVDEAIANSDYIASLCNTTLDYHRKRVPIVVPDRGYATTREMMMDLVEKGYEKKIVQTGKDEAIYWPRLEKELQVLFGANLVDYLLMVRDYVKWARDQGYMIGPGRGSIGGSLVAYLIDIADVDPIRYGLIFERFYNVGREKSLPDIDIDISKEGRDQVKEYVTKKYGADYVADVGTVIQLHPKSAINDLARTMSIPMKEAQTITKILDKAIDAGLQASWSTILEKFGDELAPWMEKYPELFERAMALAQTNDKLKDDQVKTYGVHASGVIVGDEPLAAVYPLRWVTKDKKLVTQWDMRVAEKLGFIKADLLGLRNLDTLTELNRILIETGREPINFDALQDMEHPDEMWQLMDKGLTVGLFQIEDGGGAKQIAKAMKPRSVEDLAVINAMNRPGPLRSKDAQGRTAFSRYMMGRNGWNVEYLNDVVRSATEETYGIFLYQEQVINFMTKIGYSLLEADDVRSIMGKKKKELIKEEFNRYFPRACQYMSEDHAREIWEQLQEFSLYGFNKSHAVEYGIILLWTIYAKFYYPAEFMVASIRTVDRDKKSRYIQEAQRMGIPVYAPRLGKAKWCATLYDEGIMLGWNDLAQFGTFISKWMELHTWDGMTSEDFEILRQREKFITPNGSRRIVATEKHLTILRKLGIFPDIEMQPTLEIEEELLGVALSDDSVTILEDNKNIIEQNCVQYSETENEGEYVIAGIIRDIQEKVAKTGNPYAVIRIADDTEETTFYVWNNELKRLSFMWRTRNAGLFNVKRDAKGFLTLKDAAVLYRKGGVRTKYESKY